MRIARIEWKGSPTWTEVDGDLVYRLEGDRFARARRGEVLGPLPQAKLLAPIEPANKIIGLLGNYGPKGKRRGPGIFLKPSSAVTGPGGAIVWPEGAASIGFEAELGVVIGRRAKGVREGSALDYVMGYTIVNDVTSFPVRQEDGALSTRFKAYDTFCPLGPWIVTGLDGADLRLTSRLNGETRQAASTAGMAFSVAETVAWISAVMTLEPGDLISMGTPPGYGEMRAGDVIECEIERIGVLSNRVVR